MEQALQSLMGTEHRVVFVPKNKWPQIRQTYIKEHGLDKRSARPKAVAKPKPSPAAAQTQPQQDVTTTTQPSPATAATTTSTAQPQPTPTPSSAAPLPEEPPLPDEPPAPEDETAPQETATAGDRPTDPVAAAKQLFGDDIVKIEDN